MSDYTQITDFSAKDALLTGDPNKIIYGSAFDAEFAAIAVAVATKYDSTDLASEAEAQAETLNTVLVTPLRLSSWSEANDGLVADLHAVSGLATGGDKLFFFDDTDDTLKALTVGTGLAITTTTIASDDANIDHDALSNFVADEHVAHSGVTLTAGAGLTGGGTIAASRSFAVGAGNGITVNADDVALAASTAGAGLTYTTGVLSLTDTAATTTNAIDVSSGAITIDLTALTNIEGSALAATDEFLVDDGGVQKAIAVQDMGFRIQSLSTTSRGLLASDMNSIMKWTGTATLTINLNSSEDIPLGVPVVLIMDNATQELTVTAATSVTLESIYHPGGGSAASDTVSAGGMAVLVQTETDVWQISGDIST